MERNYIENSECITGMSRLPDQSIDLILSDLPYGVTNCHWDSIIPLDQLWSQYQRIIKDNGAIVLTCCQPFTTDLINSNRKWFRYCWYWRKNQATGFVFSKKQPMRCIEDIAVFYRKAPTYNPQGLVRLDQPITKHSGQKRGEVYRTNLDQPHVVEYVHYPLNLLEVTCERGLHPTQKPVALFEYLVRTYTKPGELVLDNCMGSGTTALACLRAGRDYIGFEMDQRYCEIAAKRIEEWDHETRTGQAESMRSLRVE